MAEGEKFKGIVILEEETAAGLEMIRALEPGQRQRAILEVEKTGNNILTQAFSDNVIVPYAGVSVAGFSNDQKDVLRNLIGLYIGNMRPGHARIRMGEIEKYLDQTMFAWIGETGDDSVFY